MFMFISLNHQKVTFVILVNIFHFMPIFISDSLGLKAKPLA